MYHQDPIPSEKARFEYLHSFYSKISRGISRPSLLVHKLLNFLYGCNLLSDKLFLSLKFRLKMGGGINWKSPHTFNEKLQWLKLYNRRPEYTIMADKIEAKKWVAERIGEKYIIPTLGVWTKAEEVDFDTLPDKFVIKCNHNSGTGMYICKDKQQMDVQKVRNGLRTGLQEDYFHHNGEWPYKNIKPRIIAEQYIEDKKSHELYDYKFFCFNGKVKLFKIDFDRFTEHHANYYTPTGEILPLVETAYPPQFDRIISMPSTLPQMISLAETLSCGIPFLRVDFYTIGMDIFFGELTFFPTSGMTPFEPKDWDKKLGDMLILPTKNK